MIHDNVIQEAAEMLRTHLVAYQAEINEAFDNFNFDATVNLKLRFRRFGDTIRVDSSIRCKTNAIAEADARLVAPKQQPIEFRKKA